MGEIFVTSETLIATPGKFSTAEDIKNSLDKHPEVIVYSYNKQHNRVVPNSVIGAEFINELHCDLVELDNNNNIEICFKQSIILRDGNKAFVKNIELNTATMPFERKSLNQGYLYIYTIQRNGLKNKGSNWFSEHRMLAEYVLDRKMTKNEVIHHYDFDRLNNSLDNLILMSDVAHKKLHEGIMIKVNKQKWSPENKIWQDKFKSDHSKYMTENNPAERKDITYERILEWCSLNGFRRKEMAIAFDCAENSLDYKIKKQGYKSFTEFAKDKDKNWKANGDVSAEKNPRYVKGVSFQDVCNAYYPGKQAKQIAQELNTTLGVIIKRVKMNGYKGWNDFVARYKNHKIISKKSIGYKKMIKLTIKDYDNIALNGLFITNS